jgi:hypothetical protein
MDLKQIIAEAITVKLSEAKMTYDFYTKPKTGNDDWTKVLKGKSIKEVNTAAIAKMKKYYVKCIRSDGTEMDFDFTVKSFIASPYDD